MENKELINTAIQGLIDRLEKVEKFTLDNLPHIAKELIIEATTEAKRDSVAASVVASLCVILLLGIIYVFSINSNTSIGIDIIMTVVTICSVLGFIDSIDRAYRNYEKLMFVKNCPNLFLLREFKELLVE